MFFDVPNENRIKRNLRYSHYLLVHGFLWKLRYFLQRIRFNGFDYRFLLFNLLNSLMQWLTSSELSRLFSLVLLPFGFKFKLISKSEHHEKYCEQTLFICSGSFKSIKDNQQLNSKQHIQIV